jgi:DHA1 family bicyclomycin/chloramphenicol resistance-like MFS transporter
VQRTLSAFFLGLALAQIPVGLLGDRHGRRWPLVGGLSLFVLASIACALAQSPGQLILFRFLQGMGACAGTSSARAIIRDLYSGHRAARLMAFTFLIIGISPMLAPLLGSALLTFGSWRALFAILAGAGMLAVAASALLLPETLPVERRTRSGSSLAQTYARLFATPHFLGWALIAGLATTIPFAFVTAAPFLFTHVYGLAPVTFSLLLALNAVASIVATQFAPGLLKQWGAHRVVLCAAGACAAATLLIGLAAGGGIPLMLFQLYSMALFVGAGLMLTPAAISALEQATSGAGLAAGLLGTIQLAVTAVASAAVSLFPSFTLLPLAIVLGSALVMILLIATALGRRQAG